MGSSDLPVLRLQSGTIYRQTYTDYNFFPLKLFLFYVGILPACMCTICMLDTYRTQKRALNLLELKSQTVVSHHMGGRN